VYEDALAGREVVVEEGAGERGEGQFGGRCGRGFGFTRGVGFGVGFGFGEGGEDLCNPSGGEAGVGVNVGDERAGAGGEAGLAGKGEALAGLVDNADAGVTEGDVAGAVGAGVVDHDDLAGAGGKAAGLGVYLAQDGFEAGWEVGLFVVRGNDEA
jgi:hypothetical protein